ncbi:unnamed protein product [Clonostachys chloroleuca]|uniref:Uncharacterized protein n=1 Tax=Clonostachys chloroleuca TaxID=1926264 RepID=A0AA35LSB7_9HYPO|nr:unnamed protein product [Clonostachys chloroleuca]
MEKSTKTNFLRAFITEVWFRSLVWFRLYGLESILLHLFACSQIWCMVHQLVDSEDRQPCKSNEISRAMEFSNATRSGSETVELSNATTSKSETVKSSNVTRSDMIRLFRESELAVCNTTTVAGGLIATIAVASMVMPSVDQVNWIVLALWSLSLAMGLISVLCAFNLHTTMSRHLTCEGLETWLIGEPLQIPQKDSDGRSKQPDDVFYSPDCSAVVFISAPKVLIHYSLTAYLVGFGAYLGFVWDAQSNGDNMGMVNVENIFIFFIVGISIFYPLYWLSSLDNQCKNSPYKNDWERLNGKCVELVHREVNADRLPRKVEVGPGPATNVVYGAL